MNKSTCKLIDDIINEWSTDYYTMDIVIRYLDNVYRLGITTIQIYFNEFVVIVGYNIFECYDRISNYQLQYMPDNINIQSIGEYS